MANLYRNPNGTIARRSDGKLMRAPTQAEFEDCCCEVVPLGTCNVWDYIVRLKYTYRVTPISDYPFVYDGLTFTHASSSTDRDYLWDYGYNQLASLAMTSPFTPLLILADDLWRYSDSMVGYTGLWAGSHPQYIYRNHRWGRTIDDDVSTQTVIYPAYFESATTLYHVLSPIVRSCPPDAPSYYQAPTGFGVPAGARAIMLYTVMDMGTSSDQESLPVPPPNSAQMLISWLLTQELLLKIPDYTVLLAFPYYDVGVGVGATTIDGVLMRRTRDPDLPDKPELSYMVNAHSGKYGSYAYSDAACTVIPKNTWFKVQHSFVTSTIAALTPWDTGGFRFLLWPIAETVPTEWQSAPGEVKILVQNV